MPSDLELPLRSPSPSPSPSPVGEAEGTASSVAPEDASRPVLLRATPQVGGASGGGGSSSSRRRRNANETSLRPLPSRTRRSQSFGREVSHAAAETYLLTRLAITLLRYLGLGYRWITKFLALVCYATLLMPGFVQVGCYYFFSSQVRRSIVYGDRPRNRLDLYLPVNADSLRPVVVFITGGAWIIGYKAWGSLLGRRLAERGIIVACLDYRNFPQGTISDMVEDASVGISFVCKNAECYGGDLNRIYLMGQSAGAHIAACTILNQVIKESGEKESTTWSASQIKAYFGISGGYNMLELVDHFHRRGLYRPLFLSIMEGEQRLWHFSPEILVQDPSVKHAVALMPPVILFHGTSDKSIPSNSSEKFVHTLKDVGAKANFVTYDGKTHTDLFLQDPLRGGRDELLEDIVKAIYAGDEVERANIALTPLPRRLVPEFMLKLAHKISPF